MKYNPENWHWIVAGDESRYYSSAARGYVEPVPGVLVTRIASEAELWDVLREQAPGCLPIEARRAVMTITPFQARAALIAGGLMPQVEAMMQGADAITRAAWEYATEFRRTSPTLVAMAAGLGLTDEQLDALFEQAAMIEA